MIEIVVVAAAVLQVSAAVLAVRVLRVTGRQKAWLLIAAVALVMALRRCLVLYKLYWGEPGQELDLGYESLALAVAAIMAVGLGNVAPFFLAVRRSQGELQRRTRELDDRLRELNCLYSISTLMEQKGHALDEICAGVAERIVASVPPSRSAACRITLEGRVYESGVAHDAPRAVEAEIVAGGAPVGRMVVKLARSSGPADEEPLVVEQALIHAAAERLGRAVERIRAEEARDALQQYLHQAQKMEAVGQLACGVAHDFNNLVTVILGQVAAARGKLDLAHDAQGALQAIEHAARQAGAVTDGLLRFGGKLPAEKRPLDLRGVVHDTVPLLRHSLPDAIDLKVEVSAAAPVWVRADPTQVQQVLFNLALNARDAMPRGGELRIALAEETGPDGVKRARLTVADSGVGMTPEIAARIFDPFFTTKPREQGSGLGLSIVHGIVADHGGDMDLQTAAGAGSRFAVLLPIVSAACAAGADAAQARRAAQGHGERILVAERHQQVREITVSTLQALGYATLSVADGAALLECHHAHAAEVDLLLIDVSILRPDGIECLRQLRAQGVATPAIVMAAGSQPDLEKHLDGNSALLNKPFDMDALARTVRSMLVPDDDPENCV